MDVIDRLTRYLIETDYAALPEDVVEATRRQILDTLGVTVAGSTCSLSGEMNGLVEMVRDWGGKEESTIMMYGGKVPAENAALVNATMARALDFEACGAGASHASAPAVATAFAIGEKLGGISGRDFRFRGLSGRRRRLCAGG